MDDLISRHGVSAWLYNMGYNKLSEAVMNKKRFPSSQPEIITCGECAKCQIDDIFHDYWCDGKKVWKDHFCGYAERIDRHETD